MFRKAMISRCPLIARGERRVEFGELRHGLADDLELALDG